MKKRRLHQTLLSHPGVQIGIALALLSLLTLVTPLPLGRVTQVAIYTLYAAGIILMVGYLGLVPFGGSVFFGLAGYAAALAMQRWLGGGNAFVAIGFGVLFAALVALPVGALILRRKGLYFSLLTLACSQICYEIAYKWTRLTGGENGLQPVPRPPVLEATVAFHLFVIGVVVATVALMWRLVHTPLGRLFQGVRDNEQRLQSLGYAPYRIKLSAFVASAAVTALAGALFVFLIRGAYANSLSLEHAADAVLMAVLGGVHHVIGAFWGAALFVVLEDQLSAIVQHWWIVFAPILVLVTLTAPEGLHGLVRRGLRRRGWTLVRPGIPARPRQIEPFRPPAPAGGHGPEPVLSVRGLSKRFGSLVVASAYDFDVHHGSLHSFIGPNGAGKTTFFNMLSGLVAPDAGRILLAGTDISRMPIHERAALGLARSFQIVSVFTRLPVYENVRLAVFARHPQRYGVRVDAHADEAVNRRVWSILDAIGLVERAGEPAEDLSHGERRLLEIGITLATEARLLLLDEPLAGLGEADRVRVSALIMALARSHAVVLVEHDIDRVLSMSDRITVLHQGRLIADGTPAAIAADPEVIRAYLGDPVRIEPVAGCAKAGAGHGDRIVLEATGVVGGYGGGRVLDGVSLVVRAGEAVGLLGRNGVGKTSLLRALYGELPLDSGAIVWQGADITRLEPWQINRLGMTIVPEGRRLFANLTVLDNLRIATRPGGLSLDEVFELFPRLRRVSRSPADNLSGGERQMVAIARALVVPTDLVLMDEPFEGLAPAVVKEVMVALAKLRGRVAMVIVEHHADQVLSLVDRAIVMVNGRIAWAGEAAALAADASLQGRLLGVVDNAGDASDDTPSRSRPLPPVHPDSSETSHA